ncbi:unnamed protein product [Caenorhabditis nigoni]
MNDKGQAVLYLCPNCPKKFKHPASLRRHLKTDHNYEKGRSYQIEQKDKVVNVGVDYRCNLCNKDFTRQCYLDGHLKNFHNDVYTDNSETAIFKDEETFQKWFEETKTRTNTGFFIRHSDTKMRKYLCSRIGSYESKSYWRVGCATKRSEDRCTSFLTVRKQKVWLMDLMFLQATLRNDGSIHTHFSFEHSHDVEVYNLKFSQKDLTYLINEIKLKKTDTEIIRHLRTTKTVSDRLFFTDKNDIRNLRERYGLYEGRRHEKDLRSVELLAEENIGIRMFTMPHDPTGDGLAIAFITDEQVDWLKKYSKRGVVIDDTFNITQYNVRLITLLVIDDRDCFRPAAFYISKTVNTDDVASFFLEIGKLVDNFCPEVFISDEAAQFWNGYSKIFPQNINKTERYLCHFHIFSTWKKTAKKHFKNKEDQFLLLKMLYLMLKSTDKLEFDRATLKMLSICQRSEGGKEFRDYFKRYETSAHSRASQTNRAHLEMVRAVGSMTTEEVGDGKYEVQHGRGTSTLLVKEEGCDCCEKVNVHCRFCGVCPYMISCNCPDSFPGVACIHMHELQTFLLSNGHANDEDEAADMEERRDDEEQIGGVDFELNSAEEIADVHMEEQEDNEQIFEEFEFDEMHSDGEMTEDEGITLDTNQLRISRLNCIENKLDYVQNLAQNFAKMKSAKGDEDLSNLEKMLNEFTLTLMEKLPTEIDSLPTRRAVIKDAFVSDPTIREKYTLLKRKKTKRVRDYKIVVDLDYDDVTFCAICRKMDPPGDDMEIYWLGCITCKLWVHDICARQKENKCNSCHKEFCETETLKDGEL